MLTATSPVLVRAHPKWPHLTEPEIVSDGTRLRKLAYVQVGRAPDADEQACVPGAFRVLPVELVDLICIKLLRIGFEHFFSFVRTCRAAYRIVSKRTAIEVMCMKTLFNRASLADRVARADEAEQYPFTELAKTMIRSRIEQETLHKCMSEASLHCADPTSECCRTQRAELNAHWRREPTISARFPKGTLGAEALGGRSVTHVSVAASSCDHLLCATPNGAVMVSGDRVLTVTSNPAAEFAPGCELETIPLTEYAGTGAIVAAAEGNRIAVCEHTHTTQYDVKIFDDGRLVYEKSVSEPLSHLSPDARSFHRLATSSSVEKMWIHKGAVWFVFVHEDQTHAFSSMRLCFIQPDVDGGDTLSTRCLNSHDTWASFGRIDSISVAADSGDMVLLETLWSEQRGHEVSIWCFDMKTRKFDLVPPHPRMGHPAPQVHESDGFLHQVRLSPDGLTMVVLNRTRSGYDTQRGPILLYKRSATGPSLPGDVGGALKWRPVWTGGGSLHRPVSMAMRHSPLIEAVFTPCGRRLYLFFLATSNSPGGMLRMDTTFSNEVNDVFEHIPTYRMPKVMVWSKDGLFVQTSTAPTGVLRLGLVE